MFAPERWIPNTTAALRVFVFDPNPVSGADLRVSLRANGSAHLLASGRTDPRGSWAGEFRVPEVEGAHTLVVRARGVELERRIEIRRAIRLALDTDRAGYRPGDRIRVRAVATDLGAGRQLGGAPVVFEIRDPKSNRILRRSATTDRFGVAEAELGLPDEPIAGGYEIRATSGAVEEKKVVVVSAEPAPALLARIETVQRFPWPGQILDARVSASYPFGAPARGSVSGRAVLVGGREQEIARFSGHLNDSGDYPFQVQLPDGESFKAVRLEVTVTDPYLRSVSTDHSLRAVDSPFKVSILPEAGRILADAENRFFVLTRWVDGAPASAQVTIEAQESRHIVATDRDGVGTFTIPRGELKAGARPIEAFYRVTDGAGHYGCGEERWEVASAEGSPRLAVSNHLPVRGERIRAELSTPSDVRVAYLDVSVHGQVRRSIETPVENRLAKFEFTIPEDASGAVELHGYGIQPDGRFRCDSRACFVKPRAGLKVALRSPASSVRPGEEETVQIQATDDGGRGVEASVVVALIDARRRGAVDRSASVHAAQLALAEGRRQARWTGTVKRSDGGNWEFDREGAETCTCRGGLEIEEGLASGEAWFSVRTDSKGFAALPVRAPARLGEWNLRAYAVAADGTTGEAVGKIASEAEVVFDVGLPPRLTRGDVVDVPVTLYNCMFTPRRVKVGVRAEPWFELTGAPNREVELPPRDLGTVWFRIRGRRVGSQSLTATVDSRPLTRRAEVAPDGKPFEEAANHSLDRPLKDRFSIPASTIEGSEQVILKVTPGALAQAVEGIEGMLKEPHG
jgi:hypothetical protein